MTPRMLLTVSAVTVLGPGLSFAADPSASAPSARPSLTLAYELPHMLVISGPQVPGREIRIN